MARKSAAQIAKEELEAAKAQEAEKQKEQKGSKTDSNSEEGATDANTQAKDENAASGDSGGSGDEESAQEEEKPAVEIESVHAVALRDLPGTKVKLGQIIEAPKNLIDVWAKAAWVDVHENALAYAEQKYEKTMQGLALSQPGARMSHPLVTKLNYKGETVESVLEE